MHPAHTHHCLILILRGSRETTTKLAVLENEPLPFLSSIRPLLKWIPLINEHFLGSSFSLVGFISLRGNKQLFCTVQRKGEDWLVEDGNYDCGRHIRNDGRSTAAPRGEEKESEHRPLGGMGGRAKAIMLLLGLRFKWQGGKILKKRRDILKDKSWLL